MLGVDKKCTGRYTGVIARYGHRRCDMTLGTSRHEDDLLPCHRSRMRSADDHARFAGIGNKGVRFGKQLIMKPSSANVRSTATPSVCSWAWVCVGLWWRGEESGFYGQLNTSLASTAYRLCRRLASGCQTQALDAGDTLWRPLTSAPLSTSFGKTNHFQRLNEVKELKIFFFVQRANTRKQASNRWPLPCDAMVPTVQNRAGARCPDQTRQRCVQQTRQRCAQQTSSYITTLPWLPGLIVGPCPSEESLCCPACGLAASHSSKDPPSLAYWLFASPHWTVCAGVVGVALSAKMKFAITPGLWPECVETWCVTPWSFDKYSFFLLLTALSFLNFCHFFSFWECGVPLLRLMKPRRGRNVSPLNSFPVFVWMVYHLSKNTSHLCRYLKLCPAEVKGVSFEQVWGMNVEKMC